jgi:hypothetical protein
LPSGDEDEDEATYSSDSEEEQDKPIKYRNNKIKRITTPQLNKLPLPSDEEGNVHFFFYICTYLFINKHYIHNR